MKTFDSRLLALANCPVLQTKTPKNKPKGCIVFSPHPVIVCSDDLVLTHELCHLMAGKEDYDVFLTAIVVRDKSEKFKWVLNALYDWYHENKFRDEATLISTNLMLLRKRHKLKMTKDRHLNVLINLLNTETAISLGEKLLEHKVEGALDLVVIADILCKNITNRGVCKILASSRPDNLLAPAGGASKKFDQLVSDYYTVAVSKYFNIIKNLSNLWVANKYDWRASYFGEIDWSNLPLLLLGAKIKLPVFRLMSKIKVDRKVFIVIDRSGSTYDIKSLIMDTSIIIVESLRMLDVPISVLDVGVTNDVVNTIDEPINIQWFTPISDGGTPLGDVLHKIKGDDINSLLIIITDGEPDDWDKVKSSLAKFKGTNLTCVIGNSYARYAQEIKNVIPVEPNTIIRSLLANDQRIISKNRIQ